MKTVVKTLCLALLLGVLWIPASAWAMRPPRRGGLEPRRQRCAEAGSYHWPPDDGPPFRFSHISTEQGLSSSEVWSVLRDRRGFMWFGTLDGLNRYDGYKMKVFKHALTDPTSLSDNKIRTVVEDRAGTLWIGTGTAASIATNGRRRPSPAFNMTRRILPVSAATASMPSWRIAPARCGWARAMAG